MNITGRLSIYQHVSFLQFFFFIHRWYDNMQIVYKMLFTFSTQNYAVINIFIFDYNSSLKMIKLEQPQCQQIQLIKHLMQSIKTKCINFGFNAGQARERIIYTIGTALKIKNKDDNLQRKVIAKLRSKNLDKKKIKNIIYQLDIFKNSLYDNYQSESQNNHVKLENINLASKALQQRLESKKDNKFDQPMPMLNYRLNFRKKYQQISPQEGYVHQSLKRRIVDKRLSHMKILI